MKLRELLAQVRVDPIDLLALASVAVIGVGVAMISVPMAWIIVGALGLAYAVFASRSEELAP